MLDEQGTPAYRSSPAAQHVSSEFLHQKRTTYEEEIPFQGLLHRCDLVLRPQLACSHAEPRRDSRARTP